MQTTTTEVIEAQAEIIKRQNRLIREMAMTIGQTEAWDKEIKNIEILKGRLKFERGEL